MSSLLLNREYIQKISIILLAVFMSYLTQIYRFSRILGVISIILILIFSIIKGKQSLLIFLAIKPLIDLAWNTYYFSVGNKAINLLHITGLYVFILVAYLYFFRKDKVKIYNENLILFLLGINILSSAIALIDSNYSFIYFLDSWIRVFDAFFIYFVFHSFVGNYKGKLNIVCIIWISTLFVGILSILLYFIGKFNTDISQNVTRFAGLYNDPGGPALNAAISILFGTLFIEIYKAQKKLNIQVILLYIFTLSINIFLLKITITKAAILMFFIFLIMWIGFFKKKLLLVFLLLIYGGFYWYSTDEGIRKRLEPEVEFIKKGEITMEAARPIGTGRIGHWEKLLDYYKNNYTLVQKFLGTYSNFGAHNQYLSYLMKLGILGLLVFLIIMFRFYKKLFILYKKYKKAEIYMALVLLLMFMIYGLSGNPFEYTTLLWYLMILLSSINSLNNEK